MAISIMEVIDINKYWEILSANLSTLFSSLQGKAEYGTKIAVSMFLLINELKGESFKE